MSTRQKLTALKGRNKSPYIYQRLAYIHQNPVRAGWVEAAEQYRYISAVDYAGGKGLLDISVTDIAPTIGYVYMDDLG